MRWHCINDFSEQIFYFTSISNFYRYKYCSNFPITFSIRKKPILLQKTFHPRASYMRHNIDNFSKKITLSTPIPITVTDTLIIPIYIHKILKKNNNFVEKPKTAFNRLNPQVPASVGFHTVRQRYHHTTTLNRNDNISRNSQWATGAICTYTHIGTRGNRQFGKVWRGNAYCTRKVHRCILNFVSLERFRGGWFRAYVSCVFSAEWYFPVSWKCFWFDAVVDESFFVYLISVSRLQFFLCYIKCEFFQWFVEK